MPKQELSVCSGQPKSSFVTKYFLQSLKSIGEFKRGAMLFHFHAIFGTPTSCVSAPPSEKNYGTLKFHHLIYLFVYFSATVVQEKMVYWVKLKSIALTNRVLTQGKRLILV